MREITRHKVNGLNEDLQIVVCDEPGQGGACHEYVINYCLNPGSAEGGVHRLAEIKFQNGPVKEHGINGISNEALLAIVADRLASFQEGPYANDFNKWALLQVQSAMAALHLRTQERLARGVEGTHEK